MEDTFTNDVDSGQSLGDTIDAGGTMPSVSPGDIASALQRFKASCKRRVTRNDCCVMSPMDEMMWFAKPVMKSFELTRGVVTPIADANPMRVTLYVAMVDGIVDQGGAPVQIPDFCIFGVPDASAEFGVSGFIINVSDPSETIDHVRFPGVVQQAFSARWDGSNVTAHDLTIMVVEVILRDWPRDQ